MSANKRSSRVGLIGVLGLLAGCAATTTEIPQPRPIIIHSGVRLRADHERMKEVQDWLTREQTNIEEDPSFWVISRTSPDEVYVWEQLEINAGADTVWTTIDRRAGEGELVHQIYAHLHLMVAMGRQEEWLPEAPDAVEYELERAIMTRVADAWLLGRTVFDIAPYGPLDELIYASEAGYLDAFIFTARPEEFGTARAEWARANPRETDRYREWFLDTFNTEPPGLRTR